MLAPAIRAGTVPRERFGVVSRLSDRFKNNQTATLIPQTERNEPVISQPRFDPPRHANRREFVKDLCFF